MILNEPAARSNVSAAAEPVVALTRFEDLIALAAEKRDLTIKAALERDVRLVRFEDGQLEIGVLPGAAKTLVGDLSRKLAAWTGRRWMVAVSSEEGAPTVRQKMETEKAELMRGVRSDPLVQSVLQRFPGAEIVDVRRTEAAPDAVPNADVLPDPERED
jgi:DNA polymerase-3 subunit gamma/tau